MLTQATQESPLSFEYEVDLEEHIFRHFDDILASADLELLLVERQPALASGRLDLLALDGHGTPWILELKVGSASSQIVSQALRYADIVRQMSKEQFLALAAAHPDVDLEHRFAARFKRKFELDAANLPRVMLIAKEYDSDALQMIQTLRKYDVPILPLCYVVEDQRILLVPADEHHSVPQKRELSVNVVAPVSTSGKESQTPEYRVPVREEVARFWDWFDATYSAPVAPVSLIIRRFALWRSKTRSRALRVPPPNIGLLAREIKKLALADDQWGRVFYRQDREAAESANESNVLEARRRHGYPFTRVAYVRREQFDQIVDLVE